MRLFRRRNKTSQTNVPQEVQDYYTAERRERKSVAWLLAVVTFIVTLLIALALFYTGRWIYRKISNDSQNTIDTSQTQSETNQNDSNTDSSRSTDQQAGGSTNQTPDSNTGINQSQSGTINTGSVSDSQTSSTSTSTPSPVVGGSNTEIPRTGPDIDL